MKTLTAVSMGALLTLSATTWPQPRPATTLTVEVVGLRSDRGHARVLLFQSADGFPDDRARAAQAALLPIHGGVATITFEGVPSGTWAVSVLHDENGNGALDRGFMGRPTEGLGASNAARGERGPPKFDDARFTVDHAAVALRITVAYP